MTEQRETPPTDDLGYRTDLWLAIDEYGTVTRERAGGGHVIIGDADFQYDDGGDPTVCHIKLFAYIAVVDVDVTANIVTADFDRNTLPPD